LSPAFVSSNRALLLSGVRLCVGVRGESAIAYHRCKRTSELGVLLVYFRDQGGVREDRSPDLSDVHYIFTHANHHTPRLRPNGMGNFHEHEQSERGGEHRWIRGVVEKLSTPCR